MISAQARKGTGERKDGLAQGDREGGLPVISYPTGSTPPFPQEDAATQASLKQKLKKTLKGTLLIAETPGVPGRAV